MSAECGIFTDSAHRSIQSMSRMSYHLCACYFHVQRLKVKFINCKKIVGKSYERTLVSDFVILPQKWFKIAARKKVDIWVLMNHPGRMLLCIVGELEEGGSVAVGVGVSDM